MKKSHAISLFKSASGLATALHISEPAVSQWPEEAIPKLREYEILELVAARDNSNEETVTP